MILLIYLNVGCSMHPRLREGLFQSKDLSELLIVARVVFGQTDVANVKLHTFLLQVIGLDALAGRAPAEASKNLLPFLGEREVDEQLAYVRMGRIASQSDGCNPADYRVRWNRFNRRATFLCGLNQVVIVV